jgi:hypothetical protein
MENQVSSYKFLIEETLLFSKPRLKGELLSGPPRAHCSVLNNSEFYEAKNFLQEKAVEATKQKKEERRKKT